MNNPNDRDGATTAAKAAHFLDVHSGAVVPEIQLSTTFARDDRYALLNPANLYARDDSPAFVHAERTLADLENGEECKLFASGMAAIAAVFYTLSPGSHVVLPQAMYWGAKLWITWCDGMCGQHDRNSGLYQATRSRSGSRDAFGHKVPERPQ